MSSQNDVANIACSILGVSPIQVSISVDTTLHAITFNSLWNSVRQAEIRKRVWKFAITRAQLDPVIYYGTMVAGGISANNGFGAGNYGTINPTTDVNGNTITTVSDIGGSSTFVFGLGSSTTLAQNYFDSITVIGGSVNTTLQSSAAAAFVGGGGQFAWSWTGMLGIVNGTTYTVGLNTNGIATTATAAAPINGSYNSQYVIPANALRLLAAGDQDFSFPGIDLSDYRSIPTQSDYLVEGGMILTNQAAPLSLRYEQDITDTTRWDATFCDMFGARLAHRACFRITNSLSQQKLAMQEYALALKEAVRTGAFEGPPQYVADDSWILTRPIGSGGAPTVRIG